MLPKTHAARIALAVAGFVLMLTLVPLAVAAKGGKANSSASAATGTLGGPVMVVDVSGNGSPNAGDSVTFNVTSTAQYPFVRLVCTQNGATASQQTLGFFGGWMSTFYLGSMVWTAGAADCTATLYSQAADGTVQPTEATLSFHVGA